ncbi:MAG: hypothetical protein QOI36_5067 [Pseudonocardiales bacterium]|nr:hypothetical protein [Pseudonocardiales bacterium]
MIGHFADADAEAVPGCLCGGMARMPPPSSTAMIPTEFGQVHVHPCCCPPEPVASLSLIDSACVFWRSLKIVVVSLVTLPAAPNFLRTRMSSWISGGVGRRRIPPTTSCALSTFRRRR